MPEDVKAPLGWAAPLAERYRLDELIGSGSVAEVHRAEDIRLRRAVAVKLFRPDPDPVAQRRFGDEARLLARLSHPGLVSIFDAGIDAGQPYLVMRLVEGESLRARLRAGPLAPAEVIRLGTSLAGALEHVHSHGIVHRDVKPANVLLDTEGNPYLADFGIALLAGTVRLTNAGEIVGTAAYLAPEQVRGEEVAPAIDVYALGLVLLECLTGELAYPGSSQTESAVARLHRPPHIPPTVPTGLAELLAALTAFDARRRPTLEQCVDALRTLDPGTPLTELPTVFVAPAPPPVPPAGPARPAANRARRVRRMRTRLMVAQPEPSRPLLSQPQFAPPPVERRGRRLLIVTGVVVAIVAGLVLMLATRQQSGGHPGAPSGPAQATSHAVPPGPTTAPTAVGAGPTVGAPAAPAQVPLGHGPAQSPHGNGKGHGNGNSGRH